MILLQNYKLYYHDNLPKHDGNRHAGTNFTSLDTGVFMRTSMCRGSVHTNTHAHKHTYKIPMGDSLLSSSQRPNPSEKIVSFAILFKT